MRNSNKNLNKKNIKKNISNNKNLNKNNLNKNTAKMKLLMVLGTVILIIAVLYLMNYFFVEKSYLKINMSTDKQLDYITLEGEEELMTTQKFVSDLEYSMRYDVNKFTVFKYKKQDIYKFVEDERILIVVERSGLPKSCESSTLEMTYNNCYVKIDNYTEEYYVSTNGRTYKITIKSPSTSEYEEGIKARMNYMINTFEMIFK